MTLQERLRNLWLDAGRQTREEAADRIDALERENAALRDALQEVLAYCEEAGHDWLCMKQACNALRAIDAAMAQHNGGQGGNIAGDGRNPLPGVAYAGQGWKR